ncbi:hypothetical protein L916_02987 [Phytophthora nicotianae]|uniref:Uncharacterized protein n=1 Tax=Phytophthora nicotianae TaxID=4792 RepID=W2JNR4_PHYNI|nr:hypothetical protein L916_02987 [Phytophthora nicotianae]
MVNPTDRQPLRDRSYARISVEDLRCKMELRERPGESGSSWPTGKGKSGWIILSSARRKMLWIKTESFGFVKDRSVAEPSCMCDREGFW